MAVVEKYRSEVTFFAFVIRNLHACIRNLHAFIRNLHACIFYVFQLWLSGPFIIEMASWTSAETFNHIWKGLGYMVTIQ